MSQQEQELFRDMFTALSRLSRQCDTLRFPEWKETSAERNAKDVLERVYQSIREGATYECLQSQL